MTTKNDQLPPLQKEIILLLSKEGPLTKHGIAKKLDKSYKNVDFALNSLKIKNLIEPSGTKHYRNQRFNTYWLTLKGVVEAFVNGASIQQLKVLTENVLKQKSEHLDVFFDLMASLKRKNARKILGMIDFSNGRPRLISIDLNIMNEKEARKVLRVVKKYESYRRKVKQALQSVIDELEA